jgi:hypothetical protein
MEAVLDDLAVALLPLPDVTHLVSNTSDGNDCRYDQGLTLTDYNCLPDTESSARCVRSRR